MWAYNDCTYTSFYPYPVASSIGTRGHVHVLLTAELYMYNYTCVHVHVGASYQVPGRESFLVDH